MRSLHTVVSLKPGQIVTMEGMVRQRVVQYLGGNSYEVEDLSWLAELRWRLRTWVSRRGR